MRLHFAGRHNVVNALAAAGIGLVLGLTLEQVARGLEAARPAKGRCVWRRAGALRILDDTYNANPTSVSAALVTLAAATEARRRVVVLGDMLELGEISEAAHRDMGRAVAASGAAEFVGMGRWASTAVEAARQAGLAESHHVTTFEDTVALLLKRLAPGDAVLVKGSRGMRMERVVDALAKYNTAFNVFRYITFRTAMATVTALVISFLLGPWLINRLREMQHGESSVREDTPERHQKTKAGTPTMGGIGILVAILVSTLLWANLRNRYIWVLMLATLGLGLIGLKDDWKKLRTRRGISAKEKFGAQIALVGALMAFLYWWPADGFTTSVVIPFFKGWLITFGWLWIPFAILVIVGASNAVNLTDGLDGLAIGPIVTAGGAFAVITYLTGNFRAAEYLRILNVKGTGELTIFCGALVGAALGFLWFNSYPAQVFMGDVGSLALGGSIGTLAVLTKSELLLPLIGGIYVVEAASVIIQVGSFKLTGKRVFKMAPLHHHYEIKGWAEPKIIVRFWIVSFMLALLALTTLKLR